jgi:hypothetical protein
MENKNKINSKKKKNSNKRFPPQLRFKLSRCNLAEFQPKEGCGNQFSRFLFIEDKLLSQTE